jgi:hypothetical protein
VTGTVLRVDGGYWLQQKAPTVTSA